MIVLFMEGGLGNQLFQYSAARTLSKLRNDDEIVFDTSFYKNGNNRRYELNKFQVPEIHIADARYKNRLKYFIIKEICSIYRSGNFVYKGNLSKIFYKCFKFLLNMVGIYIDAGNVQIGLHIPKGMRKKKNIYLYGYFQYPQFINDFKIKLKIENAELKSWELCNAIGSHICVHIRLGDYVNSSNFGICEKRYYYEAIEYMAKKITRPIFHIFSDDLDSVKKEFAFSVPVVYEEEKNASNCLIKMSRCKHFILSNSTFSWWAQRLSSNTEKIVIAPSYWYGNEQYKFYLYDKKWKLIRP